MNSPQYQNAGSAPIGQPSMGMPMAPDLPDPYQLSPLHFRLAEKRAEQSKNKIDVGTVMAAAGQGIGPDELAQHRERAQLYNQSLQLAEQTMHASDEEFDQILGMLDQMQPEDLPMRMRSPQDPWESVAAAVGMLLDKGHAAEYSAIPGMMRDQRDEQRYGDLVNAWKVRAGNLGAKRDVLEKRLQYAGSRRAEASKQYFDTIQARDSDEADFQRERMKQTSLDNREKARREGRLDVAEFTANRRTLDSILKMAGDLTTQEGRDRAYQMTLQAIDSGGLHQSMIDELSQTLSGETYTGAQKAANTAKSRAQANEITDPNSRRNQKLDAEIEGIIARTGQTKANTDLIREKIRTWPQYLQATMARVEIARSLAANTISNTQFDNTYRGWWDGTEAKVKSLQQEAAGHQKRLSALEKDIQEGRIGMADAMFQSGPITQRIQEIQGRIESLLGTAPGIVPSDGPMINPPPETSEPPLSGPVKPQGSAQQRRTKTKAKPQTKTRPRAKAGGDGWGDPVIRPPKR